MVKHHKSRGNKCSICGSSNTNKSTCPLNPEAQNPNSTTHALTAEETVFSNVPTLEATILSMHDLEAIQALCASSKPIRNTCKHSKEIRDHIQIVSYLPRVFDGMDPPTGILEAIEERSLFGLAAVREAFLYYINEILGPVTYFIQDDSDRQDLERYIDAFEQKYPQLAALWGRLALREVANIDLTDLAAPEEVFQDFAVLMKKMEKEMEMEMGLGPSLAKQVTK